jgi:phosphoribosyl 1,2-cyclic phosphate phosphodiesterase
MTLTGKFLFLGSGGSMGIPVIGCQCRVCRSDSPCNKRLRPSGLITIEDKKLLIDCGPDFRLQALHYHIDTLDGVLFTHAHHDHTAGIDELRVYYMNSKKLLPCLLSKQTAQELKIRYNYIFEESNDPQILKTKIDLKLLEGGAHGNTTLCGIPIEYVTFEQAGMLVNGFRLGDFAYLSDISHFSEEIFTHLQGLNNLVISALRFTPSPFHLSVDQAIAFSKRCGAGQTWFTHISHDLDHEETNGLLPLNVHMAYDGLELNFKI